MRHTPASISPRDWRARGVGSGEIYSLLLHAQALGVSLPRTLAPILADPPKWALTRTPIRIWREKRQLPGGTAEEGIENNPHILRARKLKPLGLAAFNDRFRTHCAASEAVSPKADYRRSRIDGFDAKFGVLVDVRAPAQAWSVAPPFAACQVAYERLVMEEANASVGKAGLVQVFEGRRGVIEIVPTAVEYPRQLPIYIRDVTDAFWSFVDRNQEPGRTAIDETRREDALWRDAAGRWLNANDRLAAAKAARDEAEAMLRSLSSADGRFVQYGAGVRVTPGLRRGAIDYPSAISALFDEPPDLERWRKGSAEVLAVADDREAQSRAEAQTRRRNRHH